MVKFAIGGAVLAGGYYGGEWIASHVDDRGIVCLNFADFAVPGYDWFSVVSSAKSTVEQAFSGFPVSFRYGFVPNKRTVHLGGSGDHYGFGWWIVGRVYTNDLLADIDRFAGVRGTPDPTAKDIGVSMGNVVAHEVAHMYGAEHTCGKGRMMSEQYYARTFKLLPWSGETLHFLGERFKD